MNNLCVARQHPEVHQVTHLPLLGEVQSRVPQFQRAARAFLNRDSPQYGVGTKTPETVRQEFANTRRVPSDILFARNR